ncbi:hypothetical protein RQP46_009125 [Phenoliferia psychrophenolica]
MQKTGEYNTVNPHPLFGAKGQARSTMKLESRSRPVLAIVACLIAGCLYLSAGSTSYYRRGGVRKSPATVADRLASSEQQWGASVDKRQELYDRFAKDGSEVQAWPSSSPLPCALVLE